MAGINKGVPNDPLMEAFQAVPVGSWGTSQKLIGAIYKSGRVDAIIRKQLFRRNLPMGYFDDVKTEILLILINSKKGNLLATLDKAENIYTLLSGITFRFVSEFARSSRRFSLSIDTGESDEQHIISLDALNEIRGQELFTESEYQFASERSAVPASATSFVEKMKRKGFPVDIPSTGSSYKRIGRPKLSAE